MATQGRATSSSLDRSRFSTLKGAFLLWWAR